MPLWKNKIKSFLVNLELTVVSLIVIIPVIWIVMSSFNKGKGLASASLLPKAFTMKNYIQLFNETEFLRWFLNSFQVASLNAVISVMLILLTAWVISRFNFRGKKMGSELLKNRLTLFVCRFQSEPGGYKVGILNLSGSMCRYGSRWCSQWT